MVPVFGGACGGGGSSGSGSGGGGGSGEFLRPEADAHSGLGGQTLARTKTRGGGGGGGWGGRWRRAPIVCALCPRSHAWCCTALQFLRHLCGGPPSRVPNIGFAPPPPTPFSLSVRHSPPMPVLMLVLVLLVLVLVLLLLLVLVMLLVLVGAAGAAGVCESCPLFRPHPCRCLQGPIFWCCSTPLLSLRLPIARCCPSLPGLGALVFIIVVALIFIDVDRGGALLPCLDPAYHFDPFLAMLLPLTFPYLPPLPRLSHSLAPRIAICAPTAADGGGGGVVSLFSLAAAAPRPTPRGTLPR